MSIVRHRGVNAEDRAPGRRPSPLDRTFRRPNPFRAHAYERLAIDYERKEKNHSMALEMTRAARVLDDSPSLAKRETRLAARPGRLL
ncbi:MAG TPA: hypothetical protein PLZ95_12900 [Bryobacteraceae bacterium]|nr:hypothetical protein [Bryobacteraceae bacterium]